MPDLNEPLDKTGGPAFPCHTNPRPGELSNAPLGMTLRDWFAGHTFAAIVGNGVPSTDESGQAAAKMAYMLADAMLAAREGKGVPLESIATR